MKQTKEYPIGGKVWHPKELGNKLEEIRDELISEGCTDISLQVALNLDKTAVVATYCAPTAIPKYDDVISDLLLMSERSQQAGNMELLNKIQSIYEFVHNQQEIIEVYEDGLQEQFDKEFGVAEPENPYIYLEDGNRTNVWDELVEVDPRDENNYIYTEWFRVGDTVEVIKTGEVGYVTYSNSRTGDVSVLVTESSPDKGVLHHLYVQDIRPTA